MEKQKCGYLNPDNTCNCTLRCGVGIIPSEHEKQTKILGKDCIAYKDNYHTVFNKALEEIKFAMQTLNSLRSENV